ncbi:MAG: glycosyltransferase family 39 protein [Thermodesulfovibrionales bacterium]|nr:glycosyltransferase family 39 protein [Thermodesulfovibrionales bacterium]
MRGKIIAGIILIIFYGLLINLPYYHLKEFQGEEGRRVVIALEMIKSGDYVVPTLEGEVYLNKPPLFNWLLAAMFNITGSSAEATARAVSVLSAIICAIIVSLFWLKLGFKDLWFLPGLVFLSIPDVMDKAIRAEIDMTFTLTVTASILSWFYLYELKKRNLAGWIVSLVLLTIAFLTKGIISVYFFYLTIGCYLFSNKRLKELTSINHLTGVFAGVIVFSLWFIPLLKRIDLQTVLSAWLQEILVRKEPLKDSFWRHLIDFPLQFIIGYMPWIGFLLFFKKRLMLNKGLKDILTFSLLPIISTLIIFWLIPGARVRYILPLSGIFALLIALIIEFIKESNDISIKIYFKILAVIIILSGLSIPFLKETFEIKGMVPWAGGLLLLAGGVYLFFLKDLHKRVITLLVIMFIFKSVYAAVYFPYHEKNMSYYRYAAKRINEMVPLSASLYDYNLGNYHITYYLKRDVLKIKDISLLKKGDYLITRKDHIVLPCEFKEVDAFIARKMRIGVYKKEGC